MSLKPPSAPFLLLAFEDYQDILQQELKHQGAHILHRDQRLFIAENLIHFPVWAQAAGEIFNEIHFESIQKGARALRELSLNWFCVSERLHRRSQLIQDALPKWKTRPMAGPFDQYNLLERRWGMWALLDEKKMVAASVTNARLPHGEISFKESKAPPSRAYLKLWEVLALHAPAPQRTDTALELGSSPGGWTWVLAPLVGKVISVDRAPLAATMNRFTNIEHIIGDGFKFTLPEGQMPNWIFSDMICEPGKLVDLVERWHAQGVRNFVCTLKFKGDTDFAAVDRFLKLPGSKVVHLCANKHEVTGIILE